jgi:hypothetical protein
MSNNKTPASTHTGRARRVDEVHPEDRRPSSKATGRSSTTARPRAAFDERIERARAVRIEDEIAWRGIRLKRQGRELVGPCPMCGGTDRFSINTVKQVWNCRQCAIGGDVIDFVKLLDMVDLDRGRAADWRT